MVPCKYDTQRSATCLCFKVGLPRLVFRFFSGAHMMMDDIATPKHPDIWTEKVF